MDELQEKMARLPRWARDHIKHLQMRSEPALEEAARARKELGRLEGRIKRLQDANSALTELFHHAGKAGLDWAKTVADTLEGYEIYRSPETNKE